MLFLFHDNPENYHKKDTECHHDVQFYFYSQADQLDEEEIQLIGILIVSYTCLFLDFLLFIVQKLSTFEK